MGQIKVLDNALREAQFRVRKSFSEIMRTIAFLFLFVFTCKAAESTKDGMVPIAKFVVSAPVSGRYTPWRDPQDHHRWFCGEIILINGSSFCWTEFSDVVRPEPDYSGTLVMYKEHIYLNHPGIPYPYRVAGVADGVPVLLTWEGYESWKKSGKVFELNLLYLEKETKAKKS